MLKQYIAICLTLAAFRAGQAAEPSPFAPNETELWQKLIDRDKPGSTIKDFKFISGVPNIGLTEETTPQATAVANILWYLSKRTNNPFRCFYHSAICEMENAYFYRLAREAGRPIDPNNPPSDKTKDLLMEEIDKRLGIMEKEESDSSEDLFMLAQRYAQIRGEKKVIFSTGIRHSHLLGHYIGRATTIDRIKHGLDMFAKRRYYQLDVQIDKQADFPCLGKRISDGMPLLVLIKKRRLCTAVGCFIDNGIEYLILLDPLSAEPKLHHGKRGLLYSDNAGLLEEGGRQAGMHIYCMERNKGNLTVLAIVRWIRDDAKLREIFKMK